MKTTAVPVSFLDPIHRQIMASFSGRRISLPVADRPTDPLSPIVHSHVGSAAVVRVRKAIAKMEESGVAVSDKVICARADVALAFFRRYPDLQRELRQACLRIAASKRVIS